jgi:transposase
MITRLYIGCDISKRWFDIYVRIGKQERAERYSNDEEGRRRFIKDMQALGAKKLHVCMEHTGGYELPLASACRQANFIVSVVDGARIKNYRCSFTSTGSSNDRKSARLLARFCKERRPEVWFPMPDEYRKLRELVRHRERLISDRTTWVCRACRASEDEMVQKHRNENVASLGRQIKETEQRIAEHVKAHPRLAEAVALLLTIPGIGRASAHRILGEMGPVENYSSARSLALSGGLVPITISSGQHVPPGMLPVYGNRELRNAFYFPALVNKRYGFGVAPFIERLGVSGKSKMTAITAGMRKLAHVVYGVLRHQRPYDPEFM